MLMVVYCLSIGKRKYGAVCHQFYIYNVSKMGGELWALVQCFLPLYALIIRHSRV